MRVALAILFLLLASVPAAAGDGRGWGRGPRGPVIIHKHHHNNDVGAGILGGIVGGVVGSILTAPPPPPPPPPPPRDDDLEPWTKAWYVYCSRKFRSFDPETGTFTGYDGVKKFCR